jgi:quercetin dioxygenase-like cupin family protein
MTGGSGSDGTVDLNELAGSLGDPWQRVDVVAVNEAMVRIVRLRGEFPWHRHDEDELFLCWSGEFRIELEGRDGATLSAGQLFVVPKGVEHRPVAEHDAVSLLLERPDTKQYGS